MRMKATETIFFLFFRNALTPKKKRCIDPLCKEPNSMSKFHVSPYQVRAQVFLFGMFAGSGLEQLGAGVVLNGRVRVAQVSGFPRAKRHSKLDAEEDRLQLATIYWILTL